jgi:hypothetical protein
MNTPLTRDQRTIILNGILSIVLFLVLLQVWLLTATMNAYLGSDDSVVWPAALASVACCTLNIRLHRYLHTIDRPQAALLTRSED